MDPKLRCNFIGVDESGLLAQAEELERLGVTIGPNADDLNYCWYYADGEAIKRVESQDAFIDLSGYPGQCSEGQYLYFNKGRPKDPVGKFEEFKVDGVLPDELDIIEFAVVAKEEADCVGQRDDLDRVERAIIDHIAKNWPSAKIIDYQAILGGRQYDHQTYSVQIAGYHLPKAEDEKRAGEGLPELSAPNCPEWVLHDKGVKGEVEGLDGWELVKTHEGQGTATYTAVPRKELRQDLYLEDLKSELGLKFLTGNDPIRLLNGVRYLDDSSVVGLTCPRIEVEVTEIPKNEDNCLAWVEKETEAAVRERLGRRLSKFGDGEIISYGNGRYKYISPTGGLDEAKVTAALDKRTPEQVGFKKEITSKKVVKDDVCSVVEFRVKYNKMPDQSHLPGSPKDAKLSKEELRDAIDMLANPRRVEDFADDVIRATVTQANQTGGIIDRAVDVVIAIDTSGSMDPAAELVRRSAKEIANGLKAKGAKDVRFSLVAFNDIINIRARTPLSSGTERLFGEIDKLTFDCYGSSCTEPVGYAVMKGFDILTDRKNVRMVVVLTDNDGLADDETYPITFDIAKRIGVDNGVGVKLHKIDTVSALMNRILRSSEIIKWNDKKYINEHFDQNIINLKSDRLIKNEEIIINYIKKLENSIRDDQIDTQEWIVPRKPNNY